MKAKPQKDCEDWLLDTLGFYQLCSSQGYLFPVGDGTLNSRRNKIGFRKRGQITKTFSIVFWRRDMRLKTKTPLHDLELISQECLIHPENSGWCRINNKMIYVSTPFSCWFISANSFWEINTRKGWFLTLFLLLFAMKAKAGVIKDNVLQKLIEGGLSIYTVTANQTQLHSEKGTPDDIMVMYKNHKYKVHTNSKFTDWKGRQFTRMSEDFTLQWYKSRQRKKRKWNSNPPVAKPFYRDSLVIPSKKVTCSRNCVKQDSTV